MGTKSCLSCSTSHPAPCLCQSPGQSSPPGHQGASQSTPRKRQRVLLVMQKAEFIVPACIVLGAHRPAKWIGDYIPRLGCNIYQSQLKSNKFRCKQSVPFSHSLFTAPPILTPLSFMAPPVFYGSSRPWGRGTVPLPSCTPVRWQIKKQGRQIDHQSGAFPQFRRLLTQRSSGFSPKRA